MTCPLVEERLHFGCLVVGSPVNHVIGHELLLAVTRQRAFGDAEQPAQVVVVQERVAVQAFLQLVHTLQCPLYPVEPFHDWANISLFICNMSNLF